MKVEDFVNASVLTDDFALMRDIKMPHVSREAFEIYHKYVCFVQSTIKTAASAPPQCALAYLQIKNSVTDWVTVLASVEFWSGHEPLFQVRPYGETKYAIDDSDVYAIRLVFCDIKNVSRIVAEGLPFCHAMYKSIQDGAGEPKASVLHSHVNVNRTFSGTIEIGRVS